MRLDSELVTKQFSEASRQKTATSFDKAARQARKSANVASAKPPSTSVDGGNRDGMATSGSKKKPKGERLATGKEKWPSVRAVLSGDVTVSGKQKDGSLLYQDSDGATVRVKRDANPALYDFLQSAADVPPSARQVMLNMDGRTFDEAQILRGDDSIALDRIEQIVRYDASTDVLHLTMENGTKFAVSRQLTTKTFAQVETVGEGRDKGEILADSEFYLTPNEMAPVRVGSPNESAGIVNFNLDGQEYMVTRDTNETLYSRLVGEYDSRTSDEEIGDIDTARRDSDLPVASELDTLSLETGESDPNDKSQNLTVNELAWQSVVAKWKAGIENGDIASDDDRAKLYRALQAKTAVDDGINMVTLDTRTGLNTAKATSDDTGSIIDGVAVDEQINRLLDSQAVNKDVERARRDALGKTDGGEKTAERLQNMAFSDEYLTYIAQLNTDGRGDLAKADINKTYEQLMGVDPDKAAEFAQNAEIDAMAIDLDRLVANPDQISAESQTTATRDVGKVVLQQLKKAGIDLPRRTVETIDKFVNEFLNNKQTAKDFGKALQQLGDTFAKNGQLTQKDIDNLLKDGIYQALNEKTGGGFLKTVSEMNKAGVLGTAGGMVSLASAVYQLAGKGGSLADTPEERLSIAKDFVGFVGAGRHAATFLTSTIDLLNKTSTAVTWNLDKSLPDLFGERQYNKGKGVAYDMDKFQQGFNDVIDRARPKDASKLTKLRDNFSPDEINKIQDGLDGKYHRRPNLPQGSTRFKRGASAALQILNAGADTFVGVADSVIGGLYLKKGMDSGNPQTIARGALQLASGIFGTVGGASSLAGLRGLNAAKVATAPSFWVSAILTVATVIPDIVQDVKNTKKLNAYRDDLKALFTQLDQDGLLQGDGMQAFQYMEITMRGLGQRDAPDDQSVIDYRSGEFEAFKEYVAEIDGEYEPTDIFFESDGIEHEDYDGDGDNLNTELDEDTSGTLV